MIAVRMFPYVGQDNATLMLEASDVFRVVRDNSDIKITYCLVEGTFHIGNEKYIELVTLTAESYGVPDLERKVVKWDDPFFENMQDVETQEALRVLGKGQIDAHKAVMTADIALLEARRVAKDYDNLAKFIVVAGF